MSENVYIKISVIKSEETNAYILSSLKNKFERLHGVYGEYIKTPNPHLFLYYNSREHIEEMYSRDTQFFESALKFFIENKKSALEYLKNPQKQSFNEKGSIFVILQYETPYKDIIKKQYNFFFQVSQLLGVEYAYEEIDTGFILFHKRAIDFELSLLDLTNKEEIINFFKKNGIWTNEIEKDINNIFLRMENSKISE